VSRILVTGIGVITAIGNTVHENRTALLNGKCGITKVNNFSSKYSSILPFGEIKISNSELSDKLNTYEKGLTRTTLLALHAFREAILDCKLTNEEISSSDTALIGASTVGGMCLTDELYKNATLTDRNPEYLYSYDCASVTMFLQDQYRMNGLINTINTACSSSANAIIYGANLIKNGFAKRAIVGGVDSLAKFTINGFNSLHILSSEICRPFDANRNGLNLGEAAAFIVLEKEEDCKAKNVYASLSGYYNSNDAFHASALSENGEGPYLSMKGALALANMNADQIDFINAHGTGTENNDEVESKAMLRIFENVPLFASTKSNTGHTLGAAGAVEAVYSILNLVHQEIYPGLNYKTPIESTGLSPITSYKKHPVRSIMSNSFGFGGNCSSLIFSKP
jgi:3-oxoacyl-(acyl-carrier-protein) synthase